MSIHPEYICECTLKARPEDKSCSDFGWSACSEWPSRWVEEYHVDGFRFDLTSVLCRDVNGEPMAAPPVVRVGSASHCSPRHLHQV